MNEIEAGIAAAGKDGMGVLSRWRQGEATTATGTGARPAGRPQSAGLQGTRHRTGPRERTGYEIRA
jgi:hypothetical protein